MPFFLWKGPRPYVIGNLIEIRTCAWEGLAEIQIPSRYYYPYV